MVHGSAVRGGYQQEASDVDLVVVLADDAPAKLARISQPLRVANAAARIETMLLHQDEIAASADVFPLLYRDIQQCHCLLHGADPFANVVIHDHHVRVRLEQELRDARIRLRRIQVDEDGDPSRMAGLMERKVKQLRSGLHALLHLKGKTTGDGVAEVFAAAAGLLDVDTAPLLRIRAAPAEALNALIALLNAATRMADELEANRGGNA